MRHICTTVVVSIALLLALAQESRADNGANAYTYCYYADYYATRAYQDIGSTDAYYAYLYGYYAYLYAYYGYAYGNGTYYNYAETYSYYSYYYSNRVYQATGDVNAYYAYYYGYYGNYYAMLA